MEVLNGFDPLCDEASIRSRVGYAREVEENGVREQRSCYTFSVRSLPALSAKLTEDASLAVDHNRVLLYAGEGAFDEKVTASKWRVACVEASLNAEGQLPKVAKMTPEERAEWGSQLRFQLDDEHFVALDAFNPDESCIKRPVNAVNP